MDEGRAFLKQSSHYLAGSILIMASSFISFPILTRIFSVSDYGLLGLISTTVSIFVGIMKLGFPAAIVRFYQEYKSKNRLHNFYSSLFLGSIAICMATCILFFLFSPLIFAYLDKNIIALLPLITILLFSSGIGAICVSFLRAEQRTKLYNLTMVLSRYGSLAFGLTIVLFFQKNLYGFYVGAVIAAMMTLFLMIYILYRREKIVISSFSKKILTESIRFGSPLVIVEIGSLVLNYGDRYLIQIYLGSLSLGLYLAGYNIATYVNEIIVYPIREALGPIYMNLLVNQGEDKTKYFLAKVFKYFLLLNIPVVFGFMAVGRDLIAVLASSKYLECTSILPYIVIGQSIHACSHILDIGLIIKKKTYLVTLTVLLAGLINIGLNLLLIPHFGIIGAGQSTLISYLFYTFLIKYFSFKEFSFKIDYRSISLCVIISFVMYLVVSPIDSGVPFINLITKVLLGIVIYGTSIFVLDKDVRNEALKLMGQYKLVKMRNRMT